MPHPDDLWSHIKDPEIVSAALGALPSLHDAEIISIELSREDGQTAHIRLKTMPFPGQTSLGLLTLLFNDIDAVQLVGFNQQNVIWSMSVERTDDRRKLVIESSFGLEGSFSFADAFVLSAERA